MDVITLIREVGLLQTAENLAAVPQSQALAGDILPLPSADVVEQGRAIARWLIGFGKKRHLFLTPEIRIVEQMAAQTTRPLDCLFVVPFNLEHEVRERLVNNLPRSQNVTVSLLPEPAFPEAFYPGDSLIVACGCARGDRALVLDDTYRLLAHYQGFFGQKVFVPVLHSEANRRYADWIEARSDYFTERMDEQ